MSVWKEVPKGEVLKHGDILKGINLFYGGDKNKASKDALVVVLSRDCNCFRKTKLVVAQIAKMTLPFNSLKEKTATNTLNIFRTLRDGANSPDRMYLGTVPDIPHIRHRILLDDIHTIQIPEGRDENKKYDDEQKKKENERQNWIDAHRIARLEFDFIRHLQTRMMGAFTRQGFDDAQSFCPEDLSLITNKLQEEIASKEAEEKQARQELEMALANGKNEKHVDGISRKKLKLENEIQALHQQLEQYQAND